MRPKNDKCRQRILSDVIPLFAEKGYAQVTMREAAARAGIKAGSLYHHFSGKQALYLAAMKHAFADRAQQATQAMAIDAPPAARLRQLICRFCEQLSRDPVFTRLIHREILEGDEKRLRLVAQEVFTDVFTGVYNLCTQLDDSYDPFLLTLSIISLAVHPYQMAGLKKLLPGYRPEHDAPEVLAGHITRLLLQGIGLRLKRTKNKLQGDL